MRAFFFALVLLLAGAAAWFYLGADAGPDAGRPPTSPVPVTTWTLAEEPFQSRVEALGSLRAWESVTITPSVSETVASLHFDDGELVTEGRLLVTLQQDEEQAALREQQAFLAEQEREVKRLEELVRSNQVAQTELDQRRTLAAIARSRIAQEEARIEDRTITAPFSGVLGLRQVSPGAQVEPGQVITTLDDISRMRLDFTVPARFLRFLQVGQQIEASTNAYVRVFTGEISALSSRVDPVNRSITARAVFANPDGSLKPGMLMRVTVLGDRRAALLVPEESLVSRATDHYVWKLDDGTATRTFIEIGDRKPGWVEVTSGLKVGDVIVRDGIARLRGNSSNVRVLEG
jgi:membrane fusion protein (multidrug efflux system)